MGLAEVSCFIYDLLISCNINLDFIDIQAPSIQLNSLQSLKYHYNNTSSCS
jgi:hypothetical protein